ncbi:hypothetical protein AAP_02220 [Ascosphaera apis ARSEF 7405]|uniref:Uncharacterized protein n=1 Tax=Ascosphaera apis ARSEF 7405 TaxID=392613 RepID=A0A168AN51_9EURO|nr:hypothetical protein AAP_02220 [Ascosphaera apis ARSEF 7405]
MSSSSSSATVKQSASRPLSIFSHTTKQKPKDPLLPPPAEDELLSFDIHAALFPAGSSDLPTPEAIKALQNNAESVINKLLSAYKVRTFALHDALREKDSQDVELEEMEMRLQHVRTQLDGMAERVLEQEGQMKALADELRIERLKKQKLEAAASAAFAAAGRANAMNNANPNANTHGNGNGSSSDTEIDDLQKQLQAKRASSSTMFTTDSGFESGDDVSVADTQSIFSRNNDAISSASTITSPSIAASTTSTITTRGGRERDSQPTRSTSPVPSISSNRMSLTTPRANNKLSTYDRVLKGFASSGFGSAFKTSRCTNCSGVSASDAWSIINIMRDENRGLKSRIGDLECAMEDVIALVGG